MIKRRQIKDSKEEQWQNIKIKIIMENKQYPSDADIMT